MDTPCGENEKKAFLESAAEGRAAFANDLCARLSRIEGQVRGIKRMAEGCACCNDILNQILAARAALGSVGKLILGSYIKECLTGENESGDEVAAKLLSAVGKLL